MAKRQCSWCVIEVVKTVLSGHLIGVGRSWYLSVWLTHVKPMPSVVVLGNHMLVPMVVLDNAYSASTDSMHPEPRA